jgi:hypothetical protein
MQGGADKSDQAKKQKRCYGAAKQDKQAHQ